MERQLGKPLHIQAAEAFESPAFLQKLGMARADAERSSAAPTGTSCSGI